MDFKRLAGALLGLGFLAGSAAADPARADAWIGLPNTGDGFLLNTRTGDLWMTGICLRPLEKAEKTGSSWTSRTAGMVSAGRAMAMLDQTFILELDAAPPRFTVVNPARGGSQAFDAEAVDCAASSRCDAFRVQPVCED